MLRRGIAGDASEIHLHLPSQGYHVATVLISDSDLVVGEHRGQVVQCQAIFTYVYDVM